MPSTCACVRRSAGLSVFLLSALLLAQQPSNGLAPEVPGLNYADNLYQLEARLPDLAQPYVSLAPPEMRDGMTTGTFGPDGGVPAAIKAYADELAAKPKDETAGNVDSLLISYRGKLIFESYYRRGRGNFPHYQMSITKSYTALAVGRAIQLGLLKMDDLDRPAVTFLKQVDPSKLVPGADRITLAQAMQMSSGIRLTDEKAKELMKDPQRLRGQGEIRAYLENSAPIPDPPRAFKYQEPDTALVMQVLEAVTPRGAEAFIREELLGRMQITKYHWESAVSGLPKSAAGSCILSRDMVKFGQLILNHGRWKGVQLIPEAYVAQATSPNVLSYGTSFYGFYWWVEDRDIDGRKYRLIEGRGAGGQFIFMFPELDLVAVATSHDKGMGDMLATLPRKLVPIFTSAPKSTRTGSVDDAKDLRDLLHSTLDFYGKLQRTPAGAYRDAYANDGSRRGEHACSIAAIGVGLMALCMDHRLGRDAEAPAKALRTLRLINGKDAGLAIERDAAGFRRHFFTDTGAALKSEFSTIDTAIMAVGALHCRNTFDDVRIRAEADDFFGSVRWAEALADPDGRRLYMVFTDGKPAETSRTYLFNEYFILAWLIRERQLKDSGRSEVITVDRLNTWEDRGLRLLRGRGPSPQCSFLVQFPFYMSYPGSTEAAYADFVLSQAKADQRGCFERIGVAGLWGCGAGGKPDGKYHADNYRLNPDNVVSPHILSGFMAVYPPARDHLLRLYRDPARCVETPYGKLIPRFSVDKPEWRAPRVESIDYASMLFGLAAMDPRLGRTYFAGANRFTFGR